MQRIEKSGYHHSNLLTYSILATLKNILGPNGLATLLRYGGLHEYVNNMPPADGAEGADFADLSTLFQAVDEIYGYRGGHALLTLAGRISLDTYKEKSDPMLNFLDQEINAVPQEQRAKHGLDFLMKLLTQTGNQSYTSFEEGNEMVYQMSNCSVCFGRPKNNHTTCHLTIGAMQGILQRVTGREEHQVVESLCVSKGDPYCEFRITIQGAV